MPSHSRVRAAMAVLSAALSDLTPDNLESLTQAACSAVEHVDFASVFVIDPAGTATTVAATDPIAASADDAQARLGEGPSIDAVAAQRTIVAPDLAHDPRWPAYAPQVAGLGVGAQLSVDLDAPAGSRAALNLYAAEPRPLRETLGTAEVFASQASLMLGYASTLTEMRNALDSRKAIGQALGIVMERYQLDEERAFAFLVQVSRDANVGLRRVAADIVGGHNARHRAGSADATPDHGG